MNRRTDKTIPGKSKNGIYGGLIRYRFVVILIITGCFAFVSLVGGSVCYATDDDQFLNLIAAGAFGEPVSPYLIFSNICLGRTLDLFYTLVPSLNWYFWLVILLNVLSISALVFLCTERCRTGAMLLITAGVNLLLARDYYIVLQFTKNAYLYALAGGLFLCTACRERSLTRTVSGTLLFAAGFMLRRESVILMIPFLLWSLICGMKKTDHGRHRAIFLLPVILVTILLILADHMAYGTPEWRSYKVRLAAKTVLYDHTGMHYGDHRDAYEAAGITETDAGMYGRYLYADPESYTDGWWEQASEIESTAHDTGLRLSPDVFITLWDKLWGTVRGAALPKVFLVVFLAFLILARSRGRLLAVGSLAMILGAYWYFACVGRCMWRVEIGTWLAGLFILMVPAAADPDILRPLPQFRGREILFAVTACMIGMAWVAAMFYNYRVEKGGEIIADRGNMTGRFAELYEDGDVCYVGKDFFITADPFEITRVKYGDLFRRYCYLGGWMADSPVGMYSFRQQGIDNPVRALLGDKPVRLLGDEDMAETIRRHLEEVYGLTVTAREIADGIWEMESFPDQPES